MSKFNNIGFDPKKLTDLQLIDALFQISEVHDFGIFQKLKNCILYRVPMQGEPTIETLENYFSMIVERLDLIKKEFDRRLI
jgi:hypothetical protein